MDRTSDAYRQGCDACYEHYERTGSTCIDGTEQTNPYPEASTEYEEWRTGYYDEKTSLVVAEMGR